MEREVVRLWNANNVLRGRQSGHAAILILPVPGRARMPLLSWWTAVHNLKRQTDLFWEPPQFPGTATGICPQKGLLLFISTLHFFSCNVSTFEHNPYPLGWEVSDYRQWSVPEDCKPCRRINNTRKNMKLQNAEDFTEQYSTYLKKTVHEG